MPEPPELAQLAKMANQSLEEFIGADFEASNPQPTLMVKGDVQAGVWRSAWEWDEEDWQPYTGGAHIDAPLDRRFGLIVRGESMNEVYPPGTILDCVHTIGSGIEDIQDRQRVIVIRKRFDDGLEATVKEFRREGSRAWLVPRSTSPAFQAPIEFGSEEDGIEETVIIAVVKGSYRPE